MDNKSLEALELKWNELINLLKADATKGMISFIDADLNKMYVFLIEHSDMINKDIYNLLIDWIGAAMKYIWQAPWCKLSFEINIYRLGD